MTTSDFIEKQKKLYKSLRPCFCSAIQETVHFTSDGLNHLLYDRHRPRNIREKHYRSALIGYITTAVTKATKATQEIYTNPPCRLWILDWVEIKDDKGQKQHIKVILKKKGNGNVHFWSVMQRRRRNGNNNTRTKKPKP
ncbi:MAG: hypothetical protein AAB837_00025 [Patescibacteria group bacterium]